MPSLYITLAKYIDGNHSQLTAIFITLNNDSCSVLRVTFHGYMITYWGIVAIGNASASTNFCLQELQQLNQGEQNGMNE